MVTRILVNPCPFCECDIARSHSTRSCGHWVSCAQCGASGPNARTELEAIQRWNMGVSRRTLRDMLKKLGITLR